MNRWWGSSSDSQQQSAERDQRAARRKITSLNLNPLSDNDDEFQDCNTSIGNTSIFNANLDGADSVPVSDESEDETDNMPLSAAELAVEKAKPVESADFPDDPEAWKKDLKLKFDKNDAVATMLPDDVTDEVKPILRLTQDEAGDHI